MRIKQLFIGPDGLRHGWRFLIFAVLFTAAADFVEYPLLNFFASKLGFNPEELSAPALLMAELLGLILILIATASVGWFEGRRVDSYGLPLGQSFGRLFGNGCLVGLLTIVFVEAGMLLTGGMKIHGLALHGSSLWIAAGWWIVAMLFVGLDEEYVFRGYALQSLWRGAGFWPAALVTSALFAGAHVSKPHENVFDIGMIFVLGVVLCLSARVTGSLWWAVGWHAAFDFGQFFLVGTPNGGLVPAGRLFDASFPGPAWITGGLLGTEASYFMVPAALINLIYVGLFLRRRERL